MGRIADYFACSAEGSSLGREFRGGLTMFLTTAYIIVVNPAILSSAIAIEGLDLKPQLMTATIIATCIGTILMAIWARYPIVVAPGMGLNAFFAYTVVQTMGYTWQQALAAVVVSGLIFLLISLTPLRARLVACLPLELKLATAAGIGLFLATIGMTQSGVIVKHPVTLVTMGDLTQPAAWLCLVGLIVMTWLMIHRVAASILIGMSIVTLLAFAGAFPVFQGAPPPDLSGAWLAWPHWPSDTFFAFDFSALATPTFWGVVAAFLFVDFFDTAGTLVAVGHAGGFVDKDGHLPRAEQAFLADAAATCAGAAVGTSPVTSYIESAAGIEAGARTGAAALFAAGFFALCLIGWPILQLVPAAATAPALILVGALMFAQIQQINWSRIQAAIPAMLTILGIPLTYSIASGISLGVVAHGLLMVVSPARREVPRPYWVVFACAAWWLLSQQGHGA